MKPVVITGASGQLGLALQIALEKAGIEYVGLSRQDLDVTDIDLVLDCFRSLKPSVVINAASFTAVDDCETKEDLALRVNGAGAGNVAKGVCEIGAYLMQISTDYVFDGLKSEPYLESDIANPINAYGRSKLAGEDEVSEVSSSFCIVRTSWLFSQHQSNIVKTIVKLALTSKTNLKFVEDQFGVPTNACDLAEALVAAIGVRPEGVVHAVGTGSSITDQTVSWYQFAVAVVRACGLNQNRVEPISTAELQPPRPASRPKFAALGGNAWESHGLSPLRSWRDGLNSLVAILGEDFA